jgi:hypothetical protein
VASDGQGFTLQVRFFLNYVPAFYVPVFVPLQCI